MPIAKVPEEMLFFYDLNCGVCRSVRYHLLDRLEAENLIHIRLIELNASKGSKEMEKYTRVSKRMGYYVKPTMFIGEYILYVIKAEDEPKEITPEFLEKYKLLEKQIKDTIKTVKRERHLGHPLLDDLKRKENAVLT